MTSADCTLLATLRVLLSRSLIGTLVFSEGVVQLWLDHPTSLPPTLRFLRGHSQCRFTVLTDLWVIDQPGTVDRFRVNYLLLSTLLATRLLVRLTVSTTSVVPSVTPLFPAANWLEREAWDLFGLFFGGHPDLRRILTDYGFDGFPLRRDFPATGFLEVRYDDSAKRVVTEPVEFTQDFRFFDFRTPWVSVADRPPPTSLPLS